jgi:hypothetical protein
MEEERWGKEHDDKRNWPEYNEKLVVRGMFYLDFDLFKDWNKELKGMNKNKRGGQYLFPKTFIEWEAVWHQLVDYRGLEGITRKLAEAKLIPRYNDYTTIWHRVHNFKPKINLPADNNLQVKSDGTGLKINNRGEYRMDRYGDKSKRKKHVVVVITADKKRRKLLDVDVFIEGEGESEPNIAMKQMKKLMKKEKHITNFGGDGAFDTHAMFNFLDHNKIRSSIKIRKGSVTKVRQPYGNISTRRLREVRKYQELGYEKWAEKTNYGDRWPATEGIFSAVKRKFGENIVSMRKQNVLAEALQRFWAYDILQLYGNGTSHPF